MKEGIAYTIAGISIITLLCVTFSPTSDKDKSTNKEPKQNIEIGNSWSVGEVNDIRLQDGTRCVVFSGTSKGSITCDWSSKP